MKYQRISTQKLNKIFFMLQRGHNGDRVGADCRGEPQHGELVLQQNPRAGLRGVAEGGRQGVRARRVVLRREKGARKARARGGGKDAGVRAAQARREGVRQGGRGLLAGEPNADNTRTYARRLDDIHRRLEGL